MATRAGGNGDNMTIIRYTLSTANRAISAVQSVADAVIATPGIVEEHRAFMKEWFERDDFLKKAKDVIEKVKEAGKRIEELEIDCRKLREHNHGLAEEGDKLKGRISELESELNHNSLALSFWSNWVHELCGGKTGESDVGFDAANRIKIETELATSRTALVVSRPITKWLACTAEEARANPGESEYLNQLVNAWRSVDYSTCMFRADFAYRSRAKLPELVACTNRDIVTLGNHYLGTASNGIVEYFRSDVTVGTVLG